MLVILRGLKSSTIVQKKTSEKFVLVMKKSPRISLKFRNASIVCFKKKTQICYVSPFLAIPTARILDMLVRNL